MSKYAKGDVIPTSSSAYSLYLVDAIARQSDLPESFKPEEESIAASLLLLEKMVSEGYLDGTISADAYNQHFGRLSYLIEAAIQLEYHEKVHKILSKLQTLHEPTIDQQLEIARLWIASGQPEQASSILEHLRYQSLSIEHQTVIAKGLIALGQEQEALAIANRNNFSPRQILDIAIALAEIGHIETALGIANAQPATLDATTLYSERMSSGKLDALAKIAVAVAETGQHDRARAILDEATEIIPELPTGYSSHGSCLNSRNSYYSQIARSFAQIGYFEEASNSASSIFTCFSMASYFPSSVPGDRADTIRDIINNINTVEDVMQFLPDDWQIETDDMDENASKAEVSIRLAELGELDKALLVANATRSASIWFVGEFLWPPLALLFAEHYDFDKAIYAVDQIRTSERNKLIIQIAKEMNKAGEPDKAMQFFQQFSPESSFDVRQHPDHQIDIADGLIDSGQMDLANELLNSILPQSEQWDSRKTIVLVQTLVNAQRFQDALDTTEVLPNTDIKIKALLYIATELYTCETRGLCNGSQNKLSSNYSRGVTRTITS